MIVDFETERTGRNAAAPRRFASVNEIVAAIDADTERYVELRDLLYPFVCEAKAASEGDQSVAVMVALIEILDMFDPWPRVNRAAAKAAIVLYLSALA